MIGRHLRFYSGALKEQQGIGAIRHTAKEMPNRNYLTDLLLRRLLSILRLVQLNSISTEILPLKIQTLRPDFQKTPLTSICMWAP